MKAPDWVDGEVEVPEKEPLTPAQQHRVLRMVDVLRDPLNLHQVAIIKEMLNPEHEEHIDTATARGFWSEFTEEEQTALWVAPKYGGIFTTDERKALRPKNGN